MRVKFSFYWVLILFLLGLYCCKSIPVLQLENGENVPALESTKLSVPGFFASRLSEEGNLNYEAYEEAMELANLARIKAAGLPYGRWKALGPTNVGGRITDIEMHHSDTLTILAGAASGGVFLSTDQGYTWEPVFDKEKSLAIGDIAWAPSDSSIIYVGTGEANAGGGSVTYDGMGVFKSEDSGLNWKSLGLEKTRNIGRVVVDPLDANVAYVAAMGNLFAKNPDRGVYRTEDGGENWEHALFVSDSTGCIDLAIHPVFSNIIYAVMWERTRTPSNRKYGGESSGIFRSVDGGTTWRKLSNGLPTKDIGRIGIDISRSNPNTLYAIYADEEGFFKGVYRTTNGGSTWRQVQDQQLSANEVYVSYGWWFGNIRIDPQDPKVIYVLGLDLYKSIDGGDSWINLTKDKIHYDQHGLFIHPKSNQLIIAGNDGGVYLSRNAGKDWFHAQNLPITQFYTCFVPENDTLGRLFGGSQDNGVLRTKTGKLDEWELIYDGDGFCVMVDPVDTNIIYAEYQYGNLAKSTDGGLFFEEALEGIAFEERKNWFTPVVMDPNNRKTLYYGASRVYKSTDQADSWTAISPDLSKGYKGGQLVFGTITTIEVSESDSSCIYVGTDDGNLWRTIDGGKKWEDLKKGLPELWVSSIASDSKSRDTAYVTYSGYRYNDSLAHVYRTIDGGRNWEDFSFNLPKIPVNKIVIDNEDPSTLYLATDLGVFVMYNLDEYWEMLGSNLPNVPVMDLAIRKNSRKLIAATYGRSMFSYNLEDTIQFNEIGPRP